MPHVLNRDVRVNLWGVRGTIPAGTRVKFVTGPDGGWIVNDVKLLKEISMNTHEPIPVYHYAWVDESDIKDAQPSPP